MSARNTLEAKARRRRLKLFRQTPKGYIDLVEWLKLRQRMTTGDAFMLIDNGCIRSESHTLRARFVPADLRTTLRVVLPEPESTR